MTTASPGCLATTRPFVSNWTGRHPASPSRRVSRPSTPLRTLSSVPAPSVWKKKPEKGAMVASAVVRAANVRNCGALNTYVRPRLMPARRGQRGGAVSGAARSAGRRGYR